MLIHFETRSLQTKAGFESWEKLFLPACESEKNSSVFAGKLRPCLRLFVLSYLSTVPCTLYRADIVLVYILYAVCVCVYIVYIRIRIMQCASLIYAADAWGRRMLAANYNTRAAFISVIIIIII